MQITWKHLKIFQKLQNFKISDFRVSWISSKSFRNIIRTRKNVEFFINSHDTVCLSIIKSRWNPVLGLLMNLTLRKKFWSKTPQLKIRLKKFNSKISKNRVRYQKPGQFMDRSTVWIIRSLADFFNIPV